MGGKVIACLVGGLGNQLFGYAAARRLAYVTGSELVIDPLSGFKYDKLYKRNYNLQPFNISSRFSSPSERLAPFSRLRRKLKIRAEGRKDYTKKSFIMQSKDMNFDNRLLEREVEGQIWIQGIWPSENYFEDIQEVIANDLKISPPEDKVNQDLAAQLHRKNAVALHLRFFSNPSDDENMNASIAYYSAAIAHMKAQISMPEFFIFSDQMERAKVALDLDDENVTFVSHNNTEEMAYLDMWLMSQAPNIIMANSTFSWWSAWLGETNYDIADRLTICPDPEKLRLSNWDINGFLPERWTKI